MIRFVADGGLKDFSTVVIVEGNTANFAAAVGEINVALCAGVGLDDDLSGGELKKIYINNCGVNTEGAHFEAVVIAGVCCG